MQAAERLAGILTDVDNTFQPGLDLGAETKQEKDNLQSALNRGAYAEAVKILRQCKLDGVAGNETLSLMDFASGQEEEHRQADMLRGTLAKGEELLGKEAYEDAIAFLENALGQNEDSAGRAYGMMHGNLAEADLLMRRAASACADAKLFAALRTAFVNRSQSSTDARLQAAIKRADELVRGKDKGGAAESLREVSVLLTFAGKKAAAEWKSAQRRAGGGKRNLLTRA
ncbi:MAG: hypothetical protein P4M01_07905 [Acidobacteriota bacterium]|nr:hypothetical protein [Acidobacteriota bacterium]